jgi:hypothetical protein
MKPTKAGVAVDSNFSLRQRKLHDANDVSDRRQRSNIVVMPTKVVEKYCKKDELGLRNHNDHQSLLPLTTHVVA